MVMSRRVIFFRHSPNAHHRDAHHRDARDSRGVRDARDAHTNRANVPHANYSSRSHRPTNSQRPTDQSRIRTSPARSNRRRTNNFDHPNNTARSPSNSDCRPPRDPTNGTDRRRLCAAMRHHTVPSIPTTNELRIISSLEVGFGSRPFASYTLKPPGIVNNAKALPWFLPAEFHQRRRPKPTPRIS
jgi:hypothetical protein